MANMQKQLAEAKQPVLGKSNNN